MKTVRFIAVSVVFAAIFAVSALAQTPTAQPAKVGLISTYAFGDAANGIKKYVAALNTLQAEFKPIETELTTLSTRIQNLEKEIRDIQAKLQDPNNKVPIPQATVNAKVEEYDKLTREFKFKKEGAEAQAQRREQALLSPIRQDIGAALNEYAKKNGYTVIFDIAKLDEAGMVLAADESADITKQFIAFYNARPATTAAVTK